METMHRFGVILAAAVLAGCSPPSDDAGNRQCTTIGCGSPFQLAFDRPATWAPGTYTVEVTADGAKGTCDVTMPLTCSSKPRCSGAGGWDLVLSGCALDPAQHALTAVVFEKGPATVEVRVLDRGRQLGAGRYTPVYKTSQPNGPGCQPTCRSAPIEELSLTP
jgi:hypothetical protein